MLAVALRYDPLWPPGAPWVVLATDRMTQRGIVRDEVVEAINNPTSTGYRTGPGRKRVRKAFPASGKIIDVVYEELNDRVRVITTFRS